MVCVGGELCVPTAILGPLDLRNGTDRLFLNVGN